MTAPTKDRKDAQTLRRYLVALTEAVVQFITALDKEMTQPSDFNRGKRIGALASALELVNDQARYFGLEIDYRTDKKRKKP